MLTSLVSLYILAKSAFLFLQQQLSSPCDDETASLLSDCFMLQEKERFREEWKTLEEQRKIFERERRNFTEAAIRLSHEVMKYIIFSPKIGPTFWKHSTFYSVN